MDDRKVPLYIYEGTTARFERVNKRLVIALVVTIVLLFLSHVAWLYYMAQYDYIAEDSSVTVDAKDGVANYIGNDGDIINGEDYGAQDSPNENPQGR